MKRGVDERRVVTSRPRIRDGVPMSPMHMADRGIALSRISSQHADVVVRLLAIVAILTMSGSSAASRSWMLVAGLRASCGSCGS